MITRYWYICLEETTGLYRQLQKVDYKAVSPTSEVGLKLISDAAAKHPVLKIVIFKELPLTVIVQSGIIDD